MVFSFALALVTAEILGNEGEPSARVGPVAIGQTRAQVERVFGRGAATPECEGVGPGSCRVVLAYTDGVATLELEFPHDGTVSAIELHFAPPARKLPHIPRRYGLLATWQFQNVAAGRFPPDHVRGWSTADYAAGKACSVDFETPDITAEYRCDDGSNRIAAFTLREH